MGSQMNSISPVSSVSLKCDGCHFFYSRNTLVRISKSKVQISITTKSHLSEITSFCSNLPKKLR